jgi:hypothetical protein
MHVLVPCMHCQTCQVANMIAVGCSECHAPSALASFGLLPLGLPCARHGRCTQRRRSVWPCAGHEIDPIRECHPFSRASSPSNGALPADQFHCGPRLPPPVMLDAETCRLRAPFYATRCAYGALNTVNNTEYRTERTSGLPTVRKAGLLVMGQPQGRVLQARQV